MSTATLPSLVGLGFDVVRTPVWDTIVQQAISGKETRIAKQTYPCWKWDLTYNVLRSNATYGELQQLAGFFNQRQGMFDTFLYSDADDNAVTGQAIATGDGSTTTFQMIRAFGNFIEPVLAPHTVSTVYLNGVAQSPSSYSVSQWGVTSPGVLTFNTAPPNTVAITADFTYYFPVRMSTDSVPFTLFLSQYYKAKKFSFISVKN
jgi:uncharacterized protein (TIGR02217 family)